MARPRIEPKLSDKELEQLKVLARSHCPDSEIAAFVGLSESTMRRRFDTLLKTQREIGKCNLRARQYQMAMSGDRAMAIWVGKQILGQREKFDNANYHTGKIELSDGAKILKDQIARMEKLQKEIESE